MSISEAVHRKQGSCEDSDPAYLGAVHGYMEKCEDIRHMIGMKEVYAQRKETVERLFGTAKENHGFRYTQMIGKARMEMKVGLTFACMNLKKLAKMIARKGKRGVQKCLLLIKYTLFEPKTRKTLLEC